MASLSINLRALNLIGIDLASILYRCREYHLSHLAPYATTLVKAIRTKFSYAVFRLKLNPNRTAVLSPSRTQHVHPCAATKIASPLTCVLQLQ